MKYSLALTVSVGIERPRAHTVFRRVRLFWKEITVSFYPLRSNNKNKPNHIFGSEGRLTTAIETWGGTRDLILKFFSFAFFSFS